MLLLLMSIGSAFGSQPQASSDLFLNMLNMSFGLLYAQPQASPDLLLNRLIMSFDNNYKCDGLPHHNIHMI